MRLADAPARPRRTFFHWAAVAGVPVLAVALVFLWRLEPDPRGFGTHERLGFEPCLPMQLWNVPCPGCGVTTSVTLALDGRFVDAFLNQPFGFAVFLGLLAYLVVVPVAHLRGRDLGLDVASRGARWWFAATVVAMASAWAWKFVQIRG